jgi:hypothetical protein
MKPSGRLLNISTVFILVLLLGCFNLFFLSRHKPVNLSNTLGEAHLFCLLIALTTCDLVFPDIPLTPNNKASALSSTKVLYLVLPGSTHGELTVLRTRVPLQGGRGPLFGDLDLFGDFDLFFGDLDLFFDIIFFGDFDLFFDIIFFGDFDFFFGDLDLFGDFDFFFIKVDLYLVEVWERLSEETPVTPALDNFFFISETVSSDGDFIVYYILYIIKK